MDDDTTYSPTPALTRSHWATMARPQDNPIGPVIEIRPCKAYGVPGVTIVGSPHPDDRWMPGNEEAKRRIERRWGKIKDVSKRRPPA